MTHVPPLAGWEDKRKWQQVTSYNHSTWSLPTISDSRITYHGFWQPFVGWWCSYWRLYHHNNIKYLLTINERNSTPEAVYIKPSDKEEGDPPGNLLIPSKRPTDLYPSLWPWLTKPSEGASGHLVRMPFAGITIECLDAFCRYHDWIKNLHWLRSCVHPFGTYVDHRRIEVTTS